MSVALLCPFKEGDEVVVTRLTERFKAYCYPSMELGYTFVVESIVPEDNAVMTPEEELRRDEQGNKRFSSWVVPWDCLELTRPSEGDDWI